MKSLYIFIVIILMGELSYAQTQEEIIVTLAQNAASIKCLNCRFTQQKLMAILESPTVAEGYMSYNSPDKMSWEYTSPYPFKLVVDGEKITKINNGIEEDFDEKTTRAYKGIVNVIKSITTGENLFDKSKFDIFVHDTGGFWEVIMQPKKNSIKRMFAMLTIYFEKMDNVMNELEIIAANGDIIKIQFIDVRINELCN